jgi:sulfide:quinone oxidoreductase
MARVLILGGGFGGVVAAERLAEQLGDEHQITLVTRSRQFIFYPALVKLAFGKCNIKDVSFDLRHTMLNRRVNFVEAEVAHIDRFERKVSIAYGQVEGKIPYDYLIFALGRRLATERITGFYEHAHHLLNVDKAIQFGKVVAEFNEGRAILGQCVADHHLIQAVLLSNIWGDPYTPLLTHTFPLDKIGEAYELIGERLDGVMKVAIRP